MEQILRKAYRSDIYAISFISLALVSLIKFVTPYMFVASIAYALLSLGLIARKGRRVLHAYLMMSGILIDLSLVLILELKRNAVATALEFSMTPLQQAHVGCSSIATLLYFPILTMGLMRLKSPVAAPAIKTWHMRLGMMAFFFRSLGFILMFSMLSRHL